MKIIAGVPAYNGEATIGSVVLRAGKYVDQVIVVDDGDEIEYDAYVHNYEKILFEIKSGVRGREVSHFLRGAKIAG